MGEIALSLWKDLIELHQQLLLATVSEYQALINSDIDELESLALLKKKILQEIKSKDSERIIWLNNLIPPCSTIDDLIYLLGEREGKMLLRSNDQLKDVIGKIRELNRKNQLFLNRAMWITKEIKNSFWGVRKLSLYDRHGILD